MFGKVGAPDFFKKREGEKEGKNYRSDAAVSTAAPRHRVKMTSCALFGPHNRPCRVIHELFIFASQKLKEEIAPQNGFATTRLVTPFRWLSDPLVRKIRNNMTCSASMGVC